MRPKLQDKQVEQRNTLCVEVLMTTVVLTTVLAICIQLCVGMIGCLAAGADYFIAFLGLSGTVCCYEG